jgi:acetyl esterase/lipase
MRKLKWTAAAAAAGLSAWVAYRQRHTALYFWRLFQAKRQADAYYRTCSELVRDVPYGALTGRTLDLYRLPGSGHPVVFYVYGGSWNTGDKALYALAAQRLLPEGFMLVVPDYSLYPRARFPIPTQEVAAALAWTLDNIAEYGGDPRRVIVAAHSAGAQIAGVALLDQDRLAVHGHSASDVRGFIGLSGVYDIDTQLAHERRLRRHERYVIDVVGGRHNAAAASPLTHAGPHAPPALLIHGDADITVPIEATYKFHQRLREAGVPVNLSVHAGGGHSALLFAALASQSSRLFNEVLAFARERTATAPLAPAPPSYPDRPTPATGA